MYNADGLVTRMYHPLPAIAAVTIGQKMFQLKLRPDPLKTKTILQSAHQSRPSGSNAR